MGSQASTLEAGDAQTCSSTDEEHSACLRRQTLVDNIICIYIYIYKGSELRRTKHTVYIYIYQGQVLTHEISTKNCERSICSQQYQEALPAIQRWQKTRMLSGCESRGNVGPGRAFRLHPSWHGRIRKKPVQRKWQLSATLRFVNSADLVAPFGQKPAEWLQSLPYPGMEQRHSMF